MHAPPHLTLTPALLIRAYAAGVFPMAEQRDSEEVFWVEPRRRGVLPLEGLHVPRSLAKTVRQDRFTVTVDHCFRDVMLACAEPKPGREQTWINDSILDAYTALHEKGFAHSVECWHEGKLVGGLYGVALGAAFFGESMFSRATDASKVALVHLVARLRVGRYQLLDTQFLTAHLAQFGTIEISRMDYRQRLRAALEAEGDFYAIDSYGENGGAPASVAPEKAGQLQPACYSPSPSAAAGASGGEEAEGGVSTTVSSPLSGKLILQLLTMTL
ncbi:leucyl/phenylalanyl-tRNA--protein transferase [Pedomonas mirosovicensis]|uniref:leucyl/phenylalanyl-tRNA--protein transferase n=1 Tax=Pedomonas mirosovicensis TaxID=2908641 RepID=UPI002169F4C7|nr:leucyl/phenylalanyl-tRNA--protein transferase [Pedomonas mirosovicensis]MCH8685573.1 leucyl/phenylalanyl-tRNA--protein transferase [Pedomonas mirosovicensis]